MSEEKKVTKATHTGELKICDMTLPCYVLDDGTRVLSQRGTVQSLGLDRFAQLSKFIEKDAIKHFISNDLTTLVSSPIIFSPPHSISAPAFTVCAVASAPSFA